MPVDMSHPRALGGVRVLEACQLAAGPFCTKLLADLGAEVIKIEEPGRGDRARELEPLPEDGPHPGRSSLFFYLNTNKRSITLNLTAPPGRELFLKLVATVDTLVEDFPPGTLEGWGLGREGLAERNPRLVHLSLTPFGSYGPYSHFRAHSLNCFHAGGEGYLIPGGKQYLERPPLKAGSHFGDMESGVGAAIACLAALYWQRLSGRGQHIDCSRQEWGISMNRMYLNRYPAEGKVESRATQGYPYAGNLPCKDGYVCLICVREAEWQRLVEAMGSPAWAKEERFQNSISRAQHGAELNQRLIEWLSQYTRDEVYRLLQSHRVAVGPVNRVDDLLADRHMSQRGLFVQVAGGDGGKVTMPSAPFKLSATPWRLERPAPALGEHNKEVYHRLGLGPAELEELNRARVI